MTAATRRTRKPSVKKSLNPLYIAGPLVGLALIMVIVLLVQGSGGNGSDGPKPPEKSPAELAAEQERLKQERQKKLEEEQALRRAQLQIEYTKRAAECKTADDFVKLGRAAAADGLADLAELYYNKALALDAENRGALRGLRYKEFECSRYLKEFDDLDFGHVDAELAEYKAYEGKWLPPLKFDEVVAKWDREMPELKKLSEQRGNDPYELKVNAYAATLKSARFFDDIARNNAYTIARSARPVALFIQEALSREEGHADRIEKFYAPPLQALEKHIQQNLFDKFGFKRREGFDAYMVWVLNSHGSYDNFFRIGRESYGLSDSQWAHYSPPERLAVTFLETRQGYEHMIRHALLHEMVHYYQDAYAPYGIKGMSSFWIIEGMAEWVSTIDPVAEANGNYVFEAKYPERINEFLKLIDRLNGMWPIPLVALLDIPNGGMLASAIEAAISEEPKIAEMGSKADVHSALTSWTYGFGYSMCYYLDTTNREAFLKYLKTDLEGEGGAEAFQKIFGVANLSQFEKDIVAYYKK